MKLSDQEIKYLADGLNVNKEDLAELVRKYKKKKRTGPWPERLVWWHSTKWIRDKTDRFQFLVPVLDALKGHKAISVIRNSSIGVEPFVGPGGEEVDYVLLDLSKSRKLISDQIGCSEKTLGLYIRGLVDCGLLKFFHRGPKKYYSLAYWMQYPVDPKDKNSEWDYKKVWLLKRKTAVLLKGFQLPK